LGKWNKRDQEGERKEREADDLLEVVALIHDERASLLHPRREMKDMLVARFTRLVLKNLPMEDR
jgi:hypothetical protein